MYPEFKNSSDERFTCTYFSKVKKSLHSQKLQMKKIAPILNHLKDEHTCVCQSQYWKLKQFRLFFKASENSNFSLVMKVNGSFQN